MTVRTCFLYYIYLVYVNLSKNAFFSTPAGVIPCLRLQRYANF